MLLYPSADDVNRLRQADPHGRHCDGALERQATLMALAKVIEAVTDDRIRYILEAIALLL